MRLTTKVLEDVTKVKVTPLEYKLTGVYVEIGNMRTLDPLTQEVTTFSLPVIRTEFKDVEANEEIRFTFGIKSNHLVPKVTDHSRMLHNIYCSDRSIEEKLYVTFKDTFAIGNIEDVYMHAWLPHFTVTNNTSSSDVLVRLIAHSISVNVDLSVVKITTDTNDELCNRIVNTLTNTKNMRGDF